MVRSIDKRIRTSLLPVFLFISTSAYAAYPVSVVNWMPVLTAIGSAAAEITAAITAATTAISTLIIQGTNQIIGTIEKQMKHDRELMEAAQDHDKQYRLQEHAYEIKQKIRVAPDTCVTLAQGASMAGAEQEKQESAKAISRAFIKRNMNTSNPIAEVARDLRIHEENFCSTEDVARGRCKTAAEIKYQNADLMASNLYTPSNTYTYDEKQKMAAMEFAKGIVNPIPTKTLPPKVEATPAGKMYLAQQMVEQKRLDMAMNSLSEIIASREVQPGLGARAGLPQNDISEMGLIKAYASKFIDPAWHAMIGGTTSQEEVLREMVKLMAFQSWMDFQEYRQMERVEGLLAVSLAMEVKDRADEMLSRHRAALSESGG